MSQEILEKVCSIVSEQLSVEAGEVKSDSNFQNDLGADSLDTVELVMALEEAFDIEIPDEAAELVAYPKFDSELPILGADILWFGTSQKLLAILDYQPLIQESKYLEKYCSSLGSIKKKYSAFDNNKMKNIYDSKKYFSPWVIICRGNKLNLDRDLNNIFHSFVNNYLNIYKSNPVNQFLNAEEIKINQIKYDKYSFEKDPADKLFKSFFGEKWTRKFIDKFLFTLNNEIIH